jgi:nitrogen regulatory protein PII
MKAVFISCNQALRDRLLDKLERMNIRGFTMWDPVQGRGSQRGEPHLGNHAWPTLNAALLTVIPSDKVDALLAELRSINGENETLGLRTFVWTVEQSI